VGKKSKGKRTTKEAKLKLFINPPNSRKSNQSKNQSFATFGIGPDKENDEYNKFEISSITLLGKQGSSDEPDPTISIETIEFDEKVKTDAVGISTKSLIHRQFKKLAQREKI